MSVPPPVVEIGTRSTRPTYVYELDALDRRCEALEALPVAPKSIFFATMANDHPAILERMRDRDLGVFVNSPRHLELALSLGFEPDRIVYAATNMLAQELEACVDAGVRLVLDSIGQIELLGDVRPGLDIGLRVDVGSALEGERLEANPLYRFGVLPPELPTAAGRARALGLRIRGVHAYFGTDLSTPTTLLEGLDRLCTVAARLPDVTYVDVAGGLGAGTRTSFDVEAYGRGADEILARHARRLGRRLELVIEPGRYLAASCGYFFVTVTDLKERSDLTFVGTNGSVAIFPRPLLYPDRAFHPCAVVGERGDQRLHEKPIYVCGNSTYSRDFLGRDLRLPLPAVGDRLVFGNAGAYCRSMITEFLGIDRPDEIVLDTAPVPTPVAPVSP